MWLLIVHLSVLQFTEKMTMRYNGRKNIFYHIKYVLYP